MNSLELVIRSEGLLLALEASRIAGLVATSPLPWENAPLRVRTGSVMAILMVIHGPHGSADGMMGSVLALVLGVLMEFIAGASMGFVVRMAIGISEVSANALAPQMGFGVSRIFDPATGSSDPVLTRLFRLLAIVLALITGLHRVVIGSLMESFRVMPVGSAFNPVVSAPLLLEMSVQMLVVGVRLALPLLAILFMIQIALGFVSRAAPSMQIFSIGFAVLLAVSCVVLILIIPDFGRQILVALEEVGPGIESVVVVMTGG